MAKSIIHPDAPVVLEIEDLWKSFGDNHVLKGFHMNLREGENLAVLGKSGSGKSVLIKCIIGLVSIDRGKLNVLGKNIDELNHHQLDDLRTEIGFLFQGAALYDSMTVRENLEFSLRRHRAKMTKSLKLMVEEALDSVGLLNTINLMPSELSGGMKKRVALARTLILQPKIILYDEPTSGLDPVTGKEISFLINHLQKRNNTSSVIITHDLLCAKITANRMIMLVNGKNHIEGSYEYLEQSKDPDVRAFFMEEVEENETANKE